ncbi:MAG: ATP-dependent DNA ligase [Acidimicrobiia bacterium]|nr:ATP-dependent DNA ligase [Acidimicrobiia bacterium]
MMASTADARRVETPDGDVEISRPEKILFPGVGLAKADLAEYYARVGERMVPLIRRHPVVMHRWPDGIQGDDFWSKSVPDHFPEWIRRVELPKREGGTITQVVADDVATLVYLAGQGCITPHVWLSRADAPEHPDQLIVDLDPSGEDLEPVRRGGRALRDLFTELEVPAFVKSSGSRGLHVHVPLDGSGDFGAAKRTARAVAERLVSDDPDWFTLEQRKDERGDRLFLDVLRNDYAQRAVAPCGSSTKPPACPFALPLDWDEAVATDFDPGRWTVGNVFRRLDQKADPWAGFAESAISVAELADRLG